MDAIMNGNWNWKDGLTDWKSMGSMYATVTLLRGVVRDLVPPEVYQVAKRSCSYFFSKVQPKFLTVPFENQECKKTHLHYGSKTSKEKLDPALLRPGRMDKHILLSYCSMESFRVLAKNYLKLEEHELMKNVEELLGLLEIPPADVAECLMSYDEDPDMGMRNVVEQLKKRLQSENNENKEKNTKKRSPSDIKEKQKAKKKKERKNKREESDDSDEFDISERSDESDYTDDSESSNESDYSDESDQSSSSDDSDNSDDSTGSDDSDGYETAESDDESSELLYFTDGTMMGMNMLMI
ncbi:AAA-ATPase At3g28510-like [Papaver somniferum]|uniref:AAA-ATPase At3g28510-like n=1 Tax=Papaver somniferum TaxID=3469 RepID=UPI000E6F48CD|nr:AAA-ATPase At3g28510-like [Papaver somniferum]